MPDEEHEQRSGVRGLEFWTVLDFNVMNFSFNFSAGVDAGCYLKMI